MCRLSSLPGSAFLVSLEHAFQDAHELFFVMPYMQGGDLRYHLNRRHMMSESECRFYAAEMVIALECMHREMIVYRDFKPDNSQRTPTTRRGEAQVRGQTSTTAAAQRSYADDIPCVGALSLGVRRPRQSSSTARATFG
jgi:serine/threonine protein kinase